MNDSKILLIEKKNYYNLLFSFYYSLLTTKQQEIFEYYYSDDYSLSEIADNLAISRNAVWDSLQKTINLLDEYESKLSLYKNSIKMNEYFEELEQYTTDDGKKIIKKIREME